MPRHTYFSNQTNQQRRRLNGVQPSHRLPGKPKLQGKFNNHVHLTAPQLPHKVDLRSVMTPVEDQSSVGSCTANAIAGAYEYLLRRATGYDIDVSRLFIYYNARVKDEGSDENLSDSGCTITSAIEALEESGTCLESLWPYKVKRVNKRPSDEAYTIAEGHQIYDALQIKIDLFEMKSCLAQGFPFVFGLELYESFDRAEKKGIVPMPKRSDKNRESHGSHAMLAVGYSDLSKAFIVRNSWGADWGDHGYCYIPYAYMTDEDFCFDPWAVRKLEADNMGNDYWDDDDTVDYTQADDDYDSDDSEDDTKKGHIEEVDEDEEDEEDEEEDGDAEENDDEVAGDGEEGNDDVEEEEEDDDDDDESE